MAPLNHKLISSFPSILCCFLICLTASAAPLEVNVGALLPLSGPSADEGLMVQRGMEMAQRELSEPKLVVKVQDTRADTKTAVDGYRMLRAVHGVPAVITWGSGIGVALMPLVDQERVVQIGLGTSTPKYRVEGDFSLRLFPSAIQEGEFIGKRVQEIVGKKKFAVLAVNNDYGLGLAAGFKENLETQGGEVVGEEHPLAGDADFSSYVLRIKAKNPEALYIACYAGCAPVVARQARQVGFAVPFIASSASVAINNFAKTAGPDAEGLYADLPGPDYSNPVRPAVRRFVQLYQESYNEEPGPMMVMSARGYDAIHLISAAVKKCGNADSICIRDALLDTKDHEGASGVITFDAAGDIVSSFGVYRFKSGKFVALIPPEIPK